METKWTVWCRSLVSGHSLSGASIHPRPRLLHLGDGVKTLAGLLLATLLTMSAGCAQKDWIDRTLVTVDVTGTWSGTLGGPALSLPGEFLLELEQQGSTVKGSLLSGKGGVLPVAGPIDGTVAGDVFRFKGSRGIVEGEFTVSGDEMTGLVSMYGGRPLTLRRVDPSSLSASPPR